MFKRKVARLVALPLALSTLAIGGAALAGAKNSRDVYIDSVSFSGSFGTVRNSANQSSWLRCEVTNRGNYMCDAYDGTKYKSCSGSDAQIRRAIESMGSEDDMYMQFSGGTCTYIAVSKSSVNEPKR